MAKSNLQQRFQRKANYLNRVLRTLGREERIRKPEKLTTRYVESLEALGKRKLEAFFDDELPKRELNKIANRLTGYEPLTFTHKKVEPAKQYDESNIKLYEPFKEEESPEDLEKIKIISVAEQPDIDDLPVWSADDDKTKERIKEISDAITSKTNVILFDNKLVDEDGEVLVDLTLKGWDLSDMPLDKLKMFIEVHYSDYNITNLEEYYVNESNFYSYLIATRDRMEEIFNLDTKGAEIFRAMVNGWYSLYGEEYALRAINSLEGEFWETVDRVAEYPESGEVGTEAEGKELDLNIQKLTHLVNEAFNNLDLTHYA